MDNSGMRQTKFSSCLNQVRKHEGRVLTDTGVDQDAINVSKQICLVEEEHNLFPMLEQ